MYLLLQLGPNLCWPCRHLCIHMWAIKVKLKMVLNHSQIKHRVYMPSHGAQVEIFLANKANDTYNCIIDLVVCKVECNWVIETKVGCC